MIWSRGSSDTFRTGERRLPDKHQVRNADTVIPTSVGLLTGGWGFERDENLAAARSVGHTLASKGHHLVSLDVARPSDLGRIWQSPFRGVPFCFMAVTEELLVHPLLEAVGVRHNGSPASATAIFYDKWTAGQVLHSCGVAVPRTQLIRTGDAQTHTPIEVYPKLVKPRRGGASVGLSLVTTPQQLADTLKTLAEIDDWALIQEVVTGKEYTAFLLNSRVLGCLTLEGLGDLWTNEQKRDNSRAFSPCKETSVIEEFERIGRSLHHCGVQNLSRVDAIATARGLVVLDVNTQPYLGAAAGGSVSALCDSADLTHYEFLQLVYETNDDGLDPL